MTITSRKVILYVATSIDNFIARTNGDIDWLAHEGDYGYKDFLTSVDTVIMGGKTYRQILGFGVEWPYPTKNSYVFTHDVSMRNTDDVNFIHHDIPDFIKNLKSENGKNIWLVGGGEINTILLNNNLVDEMWLFIHPVILGNGISLFGDLSIDRWFDLHDIEEYDTGITKMVYTLKEPN